MKYKFRVIEKRTDLLTYYEIQYREKRLFGNAKWYRLDINRDMIEALKMYKNLVSGKYTVIDGSIAKIIKPSSKKFFYKYS